MQTLIFAYFISQNRQTEMNNNHNHHHPLALSEMAEVDDRITLCQYLYAVTERLPLPSLPLPLELEDRRHIDEQVTKANVNVKKSKVKVVKANIVKPMIWKQLRASRYHDLHHDEKRSSKNALTTNHDFLCRILNQTNKSNQRKRRVGSGSSNEASGCVDVGDQIKVEASVVRKGRLFNKKYQTKSTTIYSSYLER